jgi:DinB superfamily
VAEPRPLTTEEVARLLQANGRAITAELSDLSPDIAGWHPAAGEWCVKECLGHLVEAERRGFAGRIRQILEAPGLRVKDWDQVRVQKDRNDDAQPLEDLLSAFSEVRAESVRLVEGLTSPDLDKSCVHDFAGTLRIQDLLHEWVHHDHNHFRQVEANIQAYVWPSMGSAQRFSEPH